MEQVGHLHGIALVINNIWNKYGFSLPKVVGWFITFNFINIAWVIFRSEAIYDAFNIIQAMFGLHGIILNGQEMVLGEKKMLIGFLLIAVILSIFGKNSNEFISNMKYNKKYAILLGFLLALSLKLMMVLSTEFLYFQF